MTIARTSMRSHPRDPGLPSPSVIVAGDVCHQEPNLPKARAKRRNAFSGNEDVAKGVLIAIFPGRKSSRSPGRKLWRSPGKSKSASNSRSPEGK